MSYMTVFQEHNRAFPEVYIYKVIRCQKLFLLSLALPTHKMY